MVLLDGAQVPAGPGRRKRQPKMRSLPPVESGKLLFVTEFIFVEAFMLLLCSTDLQLISFFVDFLRASHCGKTRQVIADLQHLGRPIEGLWRFQCSVDRAQRLYPPSKSHNKPSIALVTSAAIIVNESLNSRASGTIAAAISVASRIPAITGASAK
jgi:hypothetical protein